MLPGMRLNFSFLLGPALLVLGCGDDKNQTSDTPATATDSVGSTTVGTTSDATAGVTTSGPTSEPTSAGPTSGPTSGPTTDEPSGTEATSLPGTSQTGSTGETTGMTASTGDDTETPPGGACVVDSDCKLHNDCCDCYGIPADQNNAICKAGCDVSTCEQLGIKNAVCRFGTCTTEKVGCNGMEVLCDSLPPECPDGTVAGVEGGCWSGKCVPAISCDFVPNCKFCPEDFMCVFLQAQLPTWPTCEPIPSDCNGTATCDCVSDLVCTGIFNACGEGRDKNQIICGCPAC